RYEALHLGQPLPRSRPAGDPTEAGRFPERGVPALRVPPRRGELDLAQLERDEDREPVALHPVLADHVLRAAVPLLVRVLFRRPALEIRPELLALHQLLDDED